MTTVTSARRVVLLMFDEDEYRQHMAAFGEALERIGLRGRYVVQCRFDGHSRDHIDVGLRMSMDSLAECICRNEGVPD